MSFDLTTGAVRRWRYWQAPKFDSAAGLYDESSLVDELSVQLEEAVRRQLVADVPVGVLLSGGVDSSLVTAMATRCSSKVRTFTIRFPGAGAFDETEHAREIARHFDTEHTELEAEPTTVDLLKILATQFDEPLIDSSMIPTYLVSRMIRTHCKVALGGDGGDELFGGYSSYDRLLRFDRWAARAPRFARKLIAAGAGTLLPIGYKGRNWLQALAVDLRTGLPVIASYFDSRSRRRLLSNQQDWPFVAEDYFEKRTPDELDLLQRATRMDFENYLPEDILVKVDRASMLSSLEIRAPFLDTGIMEFAFRTVPSRLKANPTSRKILLKKLALRVLPAGFDLRRKQGFSIPLNAWLKLKQWQDYFREVLFDDGQSIFNRRLIEMLLAGQAQGRMNGERLFGLVMFELWRREYEVQL